MPLKSVVIGEDVFDPYSWTRHDVEDVCAFLATRWNHFPSTARIYHQEVAEANDVTPSDPTSIDYLQQLEGRFYVVVYPADPFTITIAILIAVVAAAYLFKKDPSRPNEQFESPNNGLSSRTNSSRILARIPEIYGTVRSIPDLISVPYVSYINNREVEFCDMCIGRGAYQVTDVRDGDTLCEEISGVSIEVYGPNESPNNQGSEGVHPPLRIGVPIIDPLWAAKRQTSVIGQVLRAPNTGVTNGNNNIRFYYPDTIEVKSDANVDFTASYGENDQLTITNASPDGHTLNGTYKVLAVSNTQIILANPVREASAWNDLSQTGTPTSWCSAHLEITTNNKDKWIGPFIIDDPNSDAVWNNFVALNGLYRQGEDIEALNIAVEIEITPVNEDGTVIQGNTPRTFPGTLVGSKVEKTQRAITVKTPFNASDPWNSATNYAPDALVTYNGAAYKALLSSTNIAPDQVVVVDAGWVTKTLYASFKYDGTIYFRSGTRPSDLLVDSRIAISAPGLTVVSSHYSTDSTHALIIDAVYSVSGSFVVTAINGDVVTVKKRGGIGGISLLTPNWSYLYSYWNNGITSEARFELSYESNPTVQYWEKFNTIGGRFRIRARRVSTYDTNFKGTTVDEVRWKDCYSMNAINKSDFGDVTTIRTKTYATAGALSVKERKLNMKVTRKLPIYLLSSIPDYDPEINYKIDDFIMYNGSPYVCAGGQQQDWLPKIGIAPGPWTYKYNDTLLTAYTPWIDITVKENATGHQPALGAETYNLYPTNQADNIIIGLSLDPKIGNRPIIEIDKGTIRAEIQKARLYFQSSRATEFCHTFDSDNLTFEDIISTVADTAFSRAYRRGSVIKLSFESPTNDSLILFNHRNKLPGSETRTVRFGVESNYGGVALDWIDTYINPPSDSTSTVYVPADTVDNPKKIQGIGIRNKPQATWHAWRNWNKLKYQNTTVEFDATQEAELLVLGDRILVADNTRSKTFDGEIEAVNGLTLTLSQPFTFEPGVNYTIFIQLLDGTVQAIPIIPVP